MKARLRIFASKPRCRLRFEHNPEAMSTFLFNFKPQFAPKVASGEKTQTIRQHRKDGRLPHLGDTVKLFTALRTNKARAIAHGTVTDCFSVQIDFERNAMLLVVNGVRLDVRQGNVFARLDGFDNAGEMIEWFRKTYKMEDSFNGFCVRWRMYAGFPKAAA